MFTRTHLAVGSAALMLLTLHLHGAAALPRPLVIKPGSAHFVAAGGDDQGPGTAKRPWATVNHAAETAMAGDTVIVRSGTYPLAGQIRVAHSGRPGAFITFIGAPGEQAILDASQLPRASMFRDGLDNGAFQIERVAYVRVINLTIVNSHDAGITVRDSSDVDLINNTTRDTFSSGIAVWDTHHDGQSTRHIRVLGNTITRATVHNLSGGSSVKLREAPHEALSIGGAVDFEVAYNAIYDCDKEGIDIKETSKKGRVHNNIVHNTQRQALYVDAWFGDIRDIKIYSNLLFKTRMAGIALSVENGILVDDITINDNIIFDNDGSGIYFSKWGANNLRTNIQINRNTLYHNGCGNPKPGQQYYWMTGGLYFYSTHVRNISIEKNIFSDNCGVQVGYSDLFPKRFGSWQAAVRDSRIRVVDNLINGKNDTADPIQSGGNPEDQVKIYAVDGERPVIANPLFQDPENWDFRPRPGSPAIVAPTILGALNPRLHSELWWRNEFPPNLVHLDLVPEH